MRRFLIILILALMLIPGTAGAQQGEQLLSVRDVIELSKAGLGEEALVALIEVNQRIFPVDVDTLKTLKDAGVAPGVIVAMIRSGRTAPSPAPAEVPMDLTASPMQPVVPAQAAPTVVVVEHQEPVVREVPVPVYVAVPVRRIGRHVDHHVPRPPKAVEPVYWGWGGKLRPDAWKPAIELQKDAKIPRHPQRK